MHYCNHLSIMAAACSIAHSNVEMETFSLGYMEPLIQREEELTEAIEKPKAKGERGSEPVLTRNSVSERMPLTQVLMMLIA